MTIAKGKIYWVPADAGGRVHAHVTQALLVLKIIMPIGQSKLGL